MPDCGRPAPWTSLDSSPSSPDLGLDPELPAIEVPCDDLEDCILQLVIILKVFGAAMERELWGCPSVPVIRSAQVGCDPSVMHYLCVAMAHQFLLIDAPLPGMKAQTSGTHVLAPARGASTPIMRFTGQGGGVR